MRKRKRFFCLLAVIVLLATSCGSSLADDSHILTEEELNAAWVLTGCDENSAGYREGMAFSKDMNAHQMREWLDELLREEVSALKQMHSRLENTLDTIRQENAALYRSLTEDRNAVHYQRILDRFHEAENLRERIRWCRDQLDFHTGVISGRIELLGRPEYSPSARLTACREIEDSAGAIRAIRAELAENAENWLAQIKGWYGSLTGSLPGAQEHSEWTDTILTYGTQKPVHTSVSASLLYPGNENALKARLSPVSSALADSAETVVVDVVDKNAVGFQVMEFWGSPLEGIPVTVTSEGVSETRITDEAGGVIFESADRFSPNEDGVITVDLDYNFGDSGNRTFRRLSAAGAEVQKGEFRKQILPAENNLPYIVMAVLTDSENNYYGDLHPLSCYTAFYSAKNDKDFDIVITVSEPATLKLFYTGAGDGKKDPPRMLMETTNEENKAVFTQKWKRLVKPDTKITVAIESKDGSKTNEETLGITFIKGVSEEPITGVKGLESVFQGVGLSFVLPGDKIKKPLGDMTFSVTPPWEKFLQIKAVGNLDGSFLAYVGGAKIGFAEEGADWRTRDQKQIDDELNRIDKYHFSERQEKFKDKIAEEYRQCPPYHFPVLGKFEMSISAGVGFLGRYVSNGFAYQYSFQVFFAGTVNLDAQWQIAFLAAPPVFLDIHIQLSIMPTLRFAFYCNMDKTTFCEVKDVKPDWGAWGISLTVRLSVTLGVTVGIPGILTISVGGYCWIQVTVSIPFGGKNHFEAEVTFGGGAYLDVKALIFSYHWNIYDSGSILIARFPKTGNALPWYETLLSSASADDAEKDDDSINMRPESYPALAPDAAAVIENFGLADSGIRIERIDGTMYLFSLDAQGRMMIHNLKDGSEQFVRDEEGRQIYSFDVISIPCREEFAQYISEDYKNRDLVMLAYVSTTGFTEKQVAGEDGAVHTFRLPVDSFVTMRLCLFENGAPGETMKLRDGTFRTASTVQLDRPMGNVQVSQYQALHLVFPMVYGQAMLNDALGEKTDSSCIMVQSLMCGFQSGKIATHQRTILDPEEGTKNPYEQIQCADITKGYEDDAWSVFPNTVYLLQDGVLTRGDCVKDQNKPDSCAFKLSEEQVSFFTVFQDPDEPDAPLIFWIESDADESGLDGGSRMIHHLRAARFHTEKTPGYSEYNGILDSVDPDVTISGSTFQVQKISDTVYVYWLETAPKEKDTDPDVYHLRCVVFEPETMTASDDFVFAEFAATPGTMPANLYLAENGIGYYVRWNEDGTGSVYSFPHRLVPHADLQGMTAGAEMVKSGTDIDLFMSVMNDGNTNLGTLDLEMVLQDRDGNVLKNDDGTDRIIQTLHADFVHPEQSSRTVLGDNAHSLTGEHTIYRTDDMAVPLVQSRFNVTRKTTLFPNYIEMGSYNPKEQESETTAVTSKHILPGQLASLAMSVHIPADWSGAYHITMRLASRQGNNGMESCGEDELRLNHQKHDLDVGYRVYTGAGGAQYLSITVYNHAENGEQLRLYAEMYPDNSADPVYVDLPYYPEYTAAGMTHTIDMPVSALLGDLKAQKVEMRILAAGVDEPALHNNQFTFYVTGYTDPLRFLYEPMDTTVAPGGNAEFSAEATGGLKPYVYQWEVYMGPDLGWRTIPEAEGNVLTLKDVTQALNGRKYRCLVTDHNLDTVASREAVLNVQANIPTGDGSHALLYLLASALLLAGWSLLRLNAKKREGTK